MLEAMAPAATTSQPTLMPTVERSLKLFARRHDDEDATEEEEKKSPLLVVAESSTVLDDASEDELDQVGFPNIFFWSFIATLG